MAALEALAHQVKVMRVVQALHQMAQTSLPLAAVVVLVLLVQTPRTALAGMVAGSRGLDITTAQFAKQSVVLADALIEELNR